MLKRDIPYYRDYISDSLLAHLLHESVAYVGVKGLAHIGDSGGLETRESMQFVCELYEEVKERLNQTLNQRNKDRKFIDESTKSVVEYNRSKDIDFLSVDYKTILGLNDESGRIVIGQIKNSKKMPIAPLPEFLQGTHVTLFGPPDNAKLSINAMNAYHRQLPGEPEIVKELLATHDSIPKWGADDEDSKTPMRQDLISAGVNLTDCLNGVIEFKDHKKGKEYHLEQEKLALPIKRFPGLALPCSFMFYQDNPIPLHLYDFAVHLFENWKNPKALAFYVPKLENEEEAAYFKFMFDVAERKIKALHPEYVLGSIRVIIVLENPRAILRADEIMDELYPYFAGASLGWHDYLGSTARLFKEDPNYRIPVKADPNIVIKYIKASHDLLANTVGTRGGIKIGGMYGILPISTDLSSATFQVTLRGFFRDVITQMKRDLSGFWVAHPDFVRLGLVLVEAWKFYKKGDKTKLYTLVESLLNAQYQKQIIDFIEADDISSLDVDHPMYERQLLVADIKESDYISNSDEQEIRYNVFQSLQYITDWLTGNGCVALPTQIDGIAARVMDDLATAERSRWEVWHEIYHRRFSIEDFLRVCHEEYNFIRRDLSDAQKIVQIKFNERTEKWYPIAFKLMIKLMSDEVPVEFAPELLIPFTVDSVRNSDDPWAKLEEIDAKKYQVEDYTSKFNYYFEICGCQRFASEMAANTALDLISAKLSLMNFCQAEVVEAADFHGDIGQSNAGMDKMAIEEQAGVNACQSELLKLGHDYREKFGFKFLISAKGKSGPQMLEILKQRFENSYDRELENAKDALWEITSKRLDSHPIDGIKKKINKLLAKHQITGAQIAVSSEGHTQSLCFGARDKKNPVTDDTLFEIASLSKTVGTCFAIEYFKSRNTPLNTKVNSMTDFKLEGDWGNEVELWHLMSHSALNMHYVNGIPANLEMLKVKELLDGNEQYGYPKVEVINKPGTKFKYSGAGFMLLEYIIEKLEGKPILELTRAFLDELDLGEFTFDQSTLDEFEYAHGYKDSGEEVEATRLMFPAFAAGAMANAENMNSFLTYLAVAHANVEGCAGISHDTAVQMLHATDKGCMEFMGCKMGLGVFTAEAGDNKLAIHQGANDGFRSLYIYCFAGPDVGKGFTIFSNAELNSVLFNSEVAQFLLEELNFSGVDFSKFISNFTSTDIPDEEIVNSGYKKLVFEAFEPMLPEPTARYGVMDDLWTYNLAVDATITDVTNQRFARAENLTSAYAPVYDPALFGRQGKVMDSWESARHNPNESEDLILNLKTPSQIKYLSLSTKYHFGNQVENVTALGLNQNNEWVSLVDFTKLDGHAIKRFTLESADTFSKVKVKTYPDGGLTRIGLYKELPTGMASKFDGLSHIFKEEIPQTAKTLGIPFDQASSAIKFISASNQHYAPAENILSPFGPINMFDGFESARSRGRDHHEVVVIQQAKQRVNFIEIDFTYFVNNNPVAMQFLGRVGDSWVELTERIDVKAFAGNTKVFKVNARVVVNQIKILVFPDGGFNRIRVY
jgi:malate synthase